MIDGMFETSDLMGFKDKDIGILIHLMEGESIILDARYSAIRIKGVTGSEHPYKATLEAYCLRHPDRVSKPKTVIVYQIDSLIESFISLNAEYRKIHPYHK